MAALLFYFDLKNLLGLGCGVLLLHDDSRSLAGRVLYVPLLGPLLLFQELGDDPLLLLLELALLLLLADVGLKVVELLLHGPLALGVLQDGLGDRLHGGVADGDQHRLLHQLIGLPLFLPVLGLHNLLLDLLLVLEDANLVLHYLLLGFEPVLSLLVAAGFVQVQKRPPHEGFRIALAHESKLLQTHGQSVQLDNRASNCKVGIYYNYIAMNELPARPHLSCRLREDRYDHDEGFSDDDKQPQVMISHHNMSFDLDVSERKKTKPRFREPRTKLKFISHEAPNHSKQLAVAIADKELQSRSINSKGFDLRRKQSHRNSGVMQPVIKTKRTLLGQNLSIPAWAIQDFKQLKNSLQAEGAVIAFQSIRESNTHGFIKKITTKHPPESRQPNFIISKYNSLLRQRLKQSFLMPKRRTNQLLDAQAPLVFDSQIQNGNLELAAMVAPGEFDLYLRIDTNTHGHQNWFHFEVHNRHPEQEVYQFNVCNLKRPFRLFQEGQRVFVREVDGEGQWGLAGENFKVVEHSSPKIGQGRCYKLSFSIKLNRNKKYSVSMLPAYTYSQILHHLEQMEHKYPHLIEVGLLTYSLAGLAIPIATVTSKQTKNEDKKVVLISSRIHPGQSVASFVVDGIINKLLQSNSKAVHQLLKATIFKIIPILNPDGVVFGNFRTNYLGIDLNRAFHSDDEILNPEVCSLKALGRELKAEFGDRFRYFIDLHGHSSEKNVFSYGPHFDHNHPNFYLSRLLPKTLDLKSRYFKYSCCSFKLQQHKKHTARGHFLTDLNVMSYTIESSYAIYESEEGLAVNFEVKDWVAFGADIVDALQIALRAGQGGAIRSNRELKNALTTNEAQQLQLMRKIRSETKKQLKPRKKALEVPIDDSDAESEGQDLGQQQRKQAEKKILQNILPTISLPKVLKPAILYPTVTPRLFQVHEQRQQNFKVLYTRRNKYNTLRMVNANSALGHYKNIEELDKFRPSAKNIKLQKKLEV